MPGRVANEVVVAEEEDDDITPTSTTPPARRVIHVVDLTSATEPQPRSPPSLLANQLAGTRVVDESEDIDLLSDLPEVTPMALTVEPEIPEPCQISQPRDQLIPQPTPTTPIPPQYISTNAFPARMTPIYNQRSILDQVLNQNHARRCDETHTKSVRKNHHVHHFKVGDIASLAL